MGISVQARWHLYTEKVPRLFSMIRACVSNYFTFSSDWRQAIIWTSAGIMLIEPLGTNFGEILIGIQTFSLKKILLKMLFGKCCPFHLGLNVQARIFSPIQGFMNIWHCLVISVGVIFESILRFSIALIFTIIHSVLHFVENMKIRFVL